MRRAAGLLLTAAILPAACVHRPPPGAAPATPFAASVKATASGDQGRLRFRGVVAAAPGGMLRVEVAAAGESFLLVSDGRSLTAALSRGRLFYEAPGGESLLAEITGVAIPVSELSEALLGDTSAPAPGCAASPGRWRSLGAGGAVPTRLELRCGSHRLELRLDDPFPIASDGVEDAFRPLAPPGGASRVDARGLAEALLSAFGGKGAPGGR